MDSTDQPKQIIHLDMDAFYPSVEVLDNPALKGKPVIVGGSRERGVVSSASYEARIFGVHSAQPIATAMRLCPNGIFLHGRMSRYKEVSDSIFEIFRRFTPLVEPLSIDEAFLDVTGSGRLFGKPLEIAKIIKETVFRETGLTVSAGVAPSKFVAKIASDMEKPDGLTMVPHNKVREFLDALPVSKMWGAGKVTQKAFEELGIQTFRDLRKVSLEFLERKFGKNGTRMHMLAMGIDDRDVVPEHDVKSIGHEETFAEDILDLGLAKKELLSLSNKVARRMRRSGLEGKTVSLKVKYSDFKLITRSITLPEYTDDGHEIYSTLCDLLAKTATGKRPVRLLGVSISHLGTGPEGQLSLFPVDDKPKTKKELHTALDSICDKFGDKGIRPASLITK
jgi:DNA polymerase-4